MVIELRKYALALRFVKRGDAVVDAGAFIGSYSFIYSRLVGPSGVVFAYEPQPQALRTLIANIGKLNLQNIQICDKAASYSSGQTVAMQIYAHAAEQSCTIEPSLMNELNIPEGSSMIEVQTETLDSLEGQIGSRQLSLIKIDTEGHEDKVIEGASRLIYKYHPFVILEYGFVPDRYEPNTIEQIEDLGYICYDLKNMVQVHPGYVCLAPTDLIAVPLSKTIEFHAFLPDLVALPPLLRLRILVSKMKLRLF